jgi:co-chaperonin GroES (HSP10)
LLKRSFFLGGISLDVTSIDTNIYNQGVFMTDKEKIEIQTKIDALSVIINDAIVDLDQYKATFRLDTALRTVLQSIEFVEEFLRGEHDDFIPEEYKEDMQRYVTEAISSGDSDGAYENAEYRVQDMTDKELFEEYANITYDNDDDKVYNIIKDILASKELIKVVNE